VSEPADTVRPLLRTRQTRAFADQAVGTDELDAIADAARWSGSSQNNQPWRFVVIRERATLDAIAAAAHPQAQVVAEAPAAIAVVMPVEPKRAISLAFDEGRAAERILVAATLLGLGAALSWIGSDERTAVGEIIGVPDGHSLRTIVAIGHPRHAESGRTSRARLPRAQTVFPERWPD
jgi:nitroreductase